MEGQAPISWIALRGWCLQYLGAEPRRELFRQRHLSLVTGLELTDGRKVVVKVRTAAHRIEACVRVQQHLSAAGFPCPEPLAGPAPLQGLTATAERLVAGGELLQRDRDAPHRFAELLAELTSLAPPAASLPTLDPAPPWIGWDHDHPGTWPMADDRPADLNQTPGPDWLDRLAIRVRDRLARGNRDLIVGHGDWESQNLRWKGAKPFVVHDWDSVVARPEAVLAGAAAAVFPTVGAGDCATIDETDAFLTAYEAARGRRWSRDERQICWAAGLWVRAFNAKKEMLDEADGPTVRSLLAEASERARLAGA